MRGSGDYWGEIKAGTNNYYTQVAANPAHPRNMPYTILNAGIGARPAPNPNIAAQLAAAPTAEVAVELYQVIADAWRIELIVIQENAGNVGGTKTVIPTGDHNSRQIFLLAKQHGDWVALEPPFPGMDQFRYSWHMPFVYNSSPPNNPQLLRLAAELAASNLQRCPFMDAAGLPMPGYVLPPGGPEPPRPMVYEVYFAQPTPAQTMAYLNAGWW
jgi:hypothetical protein